MWFCFDLLFFDESRIFKRRYRIIVFPSFYRTKYDKIVLVGISVLTLGILMWWKIKSACLTRRPGVGPCTALQRNSSARDQLLTESRRDKCRTTLALKLKRDVKDGTEMLGLNLQHKSWSGEANFPKTLRCIATWLATHYPLQLTARSMNNFNCDDALVQGVSRPQNIQGLKKG